MKLLRYAVMLFFVAVVVLNARPALAYPDCKRKEEILERKIAVAKSHGNTRQAAGLERSLENVRRYCTGDSLKAKAEMKVADALEEVAEREADLEKARAKGDAGKIAKREKKLREAQQELTGAEQLLQGLK